jgi:hypothetical protein
MSLSQRPSQQGGTRSSIPAQSAIKISAERAPQAVDPHKTAMLDSRQDFVSKKAEFITLKNNNQAQSKEIHEIRPDYANTTSPPPLSVLANYFKVELPSASLYKYIVSVKISGDDDGENVPLGKRQERMKWFVANSDYFKNATDDFATDNLAIIISWNELGKLKRGTPSKDLEVIDHRKRVIRESKTLSSGKVLEEFAERYTLTYHGKVTIDDLINASKGNIISLPLHENLDLARQALNIVLSKATLNSARRPFQIEQEVLHYAQVRNAGTMRSWL